MLTFLEDTLPTPLGNLHIICDVAYRLRALEWSEYAPRMEDILGKLYAKEGFERKRSANPGGLREALRDYFEGDLHRIDNLEVCAPGTPFQQQVWQALRQIPCGEVRSYGQLAHDLAHPGASRAVGAANGANPISIVVPCHRVIGANGQLTGYAGGVFRKKWLLQHEGYLSPELPNMGEIKST